MEENNKFWSLNGVIGRRDFLVNFILVLIVELIIFVAPFSILLLINPDLMQYFVSGKAQMSAWPVGIMLWVIFVSLIKYILIYPSALRRIRDILGKNDDKVQTILISFFIIVFVCGSIPFIRYLYYVLILSLLFISGQITGAKPKSEITRFNWGAFLGTWIWGIFNRSYQTLWSLVFCMLTGFLPFMILYGLKGNEWAYNNKKYESVEAFHQSQKKQAIFWFIAFPFVCLFSVVMLFYSMSYVFEKIAPKDFDKKLGAYYVKIQNLNTEYTFDKIDLNEDEYIFSINPKLWVRFSQTQKEHLFESAGVYSQSRKDKDFDVIKNNMKPSENVLNKVKIISTFNEENLAECNIKNIDQYPNGCSFNSRPSLP